MKSLLLKQNGMCVYCPKDIRAKYHVDHILPIARGGSSWPTNIQLCCPRCNISKGPKTHDEFVLYLAEKIAA